jgi:hypothetical protein
MAHVHDHHDNDTYFIDQLCMVGLAGAFGVICLALYFWQTPMLNLLLGQQFHLFVAISGFTLFGLALVRAATLWNESRPATAIASLPVVKHEHHHHTHDHGHDHDHGHHHDHGHDHAHAHHDHDHSHDHAHSHDDHHHGHHHDHAHHDHSHDDHDHGWAPWRYVVMLVPIVLFTLGLPNKGPRAASVNDAEARAAEAVRDSTQTVSIIGMEDWSRLALLGKIAGDDALGQIVPASFKEILESVNDRGLRAKFQDNTVELRGQFVADTHDPRFFALVRFKIGCCAPDAVDTRINVFSREPITSIKRDSWAKVRGKVEYGKRGDTVVLRLVTSGPDNVISCNPDVNPYIQ